MEESGHWVPDDNYLNSFAELLFDLIHGISHGFYHFDRMQSGDMITAEDHLPQLQSNMSLYRKISGKMWWVGRGSRVMFQIPTKSASNKFEDSGNVVTEADEAAHVAPFSFVDVAIVSNDRAGPGIRLRCEHFGPAVNFDETFSPVTFQPSASSTFCFSSVDSETASTERIVALEAELAKLRSMMTQLIISKECQFADPTIDKPASKKANSKGTRPVTRLDNNSYDSGLSSEDDKRSSGKSKTKKAVIPAPSIMCSITACPLPPPPPPPLPPLLPPVAQQKIAIKVHKNTTDQPAAIKTVQQHNVPRMSDVLKDLAHVKLKPVNLRKSPGGTPAKLHVGSDAGAFIANALKRKFANTGNDSPYSDENQDWSDSTDSDFEPNTNERNKKFSKCKKRLANVYKTK